MKFSKVFPLLIAKAQRKGRKEDEVFAVTEWLTGYSTEELTALLASETTYGAFLDSSPRMNPARSPDESSQVQCQGKDLRYPCGRD